MESERKGDWMQTYTGGVFWPLDPRASEVCIEDIAHHLSLLCRFGGACRSFYSVGEHSVRVSRIVPPEHALWGLLHDASEAYLIDVPRPIKHHLREYKPLELAIEAVIAERFGLPATMPPEVKHADNVLLATEMRDLMHTSESRPWVALPVPLTERIEPWSPCDAERLFLERFDELARGR